MSAMNRRITTYRNDFNKGKYPVYGNDGQPKFFQNPGRDNHRQNYLSKSHDYSMPRQEMDMQRRRNESSDQYEDRMRHLSLDHHREHHDNHYDHHDNRHEGHLTDRSPRQHHERHEHDREHDRYHEHHHGGPLTDRGPHQYHEHHEHERRAYDDMDMDKRMENAEIYYNRGNLTYRRQPDGHDPENYDHPYDRFDPYKNYHMYSTTQKDYGKHETIGRITNQPYRYRAHFDEQATHFHNKQRVHDLFPHDKPEDSMRAGCYLLIRISGSTDEFKTMEHKFERNQSTVSSGKGKLVGITNAIHLHAANISAETHGWKVKKDGTTVSDVLAVMLFDNMEDAIRWAKSDREFKSGRSDDLAMYSWAFLRINHIPSAGKYPIYLMVEVKASLGHHTPKDEDDFRLMVSYEMESILKDMKEDISPFSVNTYVNYESKLGNINSFLDRRFVFVHRFTNVHAAREFLHRFDSHYSKVNFTYTATVFSLV